MSGKSLHALSELTNVIINSADPRARILFAQRLVSGLGRTLVCPTEILEQLCARIEKDMQKFGKVARTEANRAAHNHVVILRTFLRHRQPLIDELRAQRIDIDRMGWL